MKTMFDPQAKLLWHGDRIREWLTTGNASPILLELALTNACSANCPWCFFKKQNNEKRSFIDTEHLLRAIRGLKMLGLRAINFTGGGEPTLHPDFERIVLYARKLDIFCGLFTNGLQKIPSSWHFSWIRISITDRDPLDIVVPKEHFGICLNHTHTQSKGEVERYCLFAKKIGAKYFQIRPALLDSSVGQPVLFDVEYLKKYAGDGFEVITTPYKYEEALLEKDYSKCFGFNFCPSIDWNGNVSSCLYQSGREKFTFGNIYSSPIESVWDNRPEFFPVIQDCQRCCKNSMINSFLSKAVNVTQVDFL